ncbi:MAG: hypothetical protein GVY24_04665, partial [Planctomycetes bacterium]|nr:hypothetical protein [Planctomycetota bacterium]
MSRTPPRIVWYLSPAVIAGLVLLIASPHVCRAAAEEERPIIQTFVDDVDIAVIDLRGLGGQENWSSITTTPAGGALVGLSNRDGSAALVEFDHRTRSIRPVMGLQETGRLMPGEHEPKVHVSPWLAPDGWYYFLSHYGLETHLPLHGSRIGYDGMRWWRCRYLPSEQRWQSEHLGRVMTADGAVAVRGDARHQHVWAVTFPKSHLVRIDLAGGALHDLGRSNAVYAPRQILLSSDGRPLVLDHRGRFWTTDHDHRRLIPTQASIPVDHEISGDLLAQGLVAACLDTQTSTWYATSAWGRLYAINAQDAESPIVRDLGAPLDQLSGDDEPRRASRPPMIAGIALAGDDQLYLAVSGYNRAADPDGHSLVVRCDRDGRHAERVAAMDGTQVNYLCGSDAATDKGRRLYFAGSHL